MQQLAKGRRKRAKSKEKKRTLTTRRRKTNGKGYMKMDAKNKEEKVWEEVKRE